MVNGRRKRYVSVIINTCLCIGFLCSEKGGYVYADGPKPDLSKCVEKPFTLTAYYSPSSNQGFYYKGNYTDEVTLNGKGTHGASGKPVFNGMLAAPSSYGFGTQIYFPQWGIGQVEDRGGAIVHAGEKGQKNDRIDVWAGAGEEGLKRALSFGVQTATGYVCEGSVGKAGFDWGSFPVYKNFFESTFWIMELWQGREDPRVEVLQRVLQKLGYLQAKQVTGLYDKVTTQAVCAYQKKRLQMSGSDFRCGYFGPDTRAAMHRHLNSLLDTRLPAAPIKNNSLHTTTKPAKLPLPEKNTSTVIVKSSDDEIQATLSPQESRNKDALEAGDVQAYRFLAVIEPNEEGKHVKFLQRKLQWLGCYKGDVTGIYDEATTKAVFIFQRKYNILDEDAAPELQGYFGPATRDMLNSRN